MPETLPVDINREELHSLDVPASFETTGSFDIALRNHGEPLHVHLHLDDDLSDVARMDATNHYIERETNRLIRVEVAEDAPRPLRGKLKVVSAYGAQTRYVDVVLEEPVVERSTVEVDESLAEPQPKPERSAESVALSPELLVLALGIVALVVVLVVALVVQDLLVFGAALAVLAGVVVAMYLLYVE